LCRHPREGRGRGAGVEERNWNKKTVPKREAPGRKFQPHSAADEIFFQSRGAGVEERNWNRRNQI